MIQDIAPHTFHIAYRPDRTPKPSDRLIVCRGDTFFLIEGAQGPTFPRFDAIQDPGPVRWLFAIDETGFFLCEGEPTLPPGGFFRPVSFFRQTGAIAPAMAKWQRFAGVTAWQIVRWYRDTRFCSRCGGKLTHSKKERMLFCKACGQTVYPRISPALIIAVYDGERLLMSRYRHSRDTGPLGETGVLPAGYMEVGETPEQAAAREVWEETGVHIKNVRYYKSQPWALTDTLLLGIVAELDGSDKITLQEDELSAAEWVHRQEIVRETNDFSLTNDMICAFASGRL